MSLFAQRLLGAFRRTLPGCVAQTQAIAFNMFLALAPTVVLVLGIVAHPLQNPINRAVHATNNRWLIYETVY